MEKKLIFLLVILFVGLSGGAVYQHYNGDLSGGEFNDTLYNDSGEYVHLNYTDSTNSSYAESGTYTSEIIDFNETTDFNKIKWTGKHKDCPENMSYIDKLGGYCIDKYEASKPDANSTHVGTNETMAVSQEGVLPWVDVTQTSARTACENAGKHLCTDEEWLGAANVQGQIYDLPSDLSVSPYNCNTNDQCSGSACSTGTNSGCVSAEGVYDMTGNVWEWTNETVDTVSPQDCGWHYPNSTGGFQCSTDSSTAKYGDDGVYFSDGSISGRAVRRGGCWSGEGQAGPFCANLNNAPSTSLSSIGFRCCSNLES